MAAQTFIVPSHTLSGTLISPAITVSSTFNRSMVLQANVSIADRVDTTKAFRLWIEIQQPDLSWRRADYVVYVGGIFTDRGGGPPPDPGFRIGVNTVTGLSPYAGKTVRGSIEIGRPDGLGGILVDPSVSITMGLTVTLE